MKLYCIKYFQKQGQGPRPVLTDSTPAPVPVSSIISQPSQRCSFPNTSIPNHFQLENLAGLGGDLGSRALSTLLALDALGTTLGGGELGLLGLLGAGGSSLLLLGVLDGLLASGLTGLGALGAALLDHIEGSTNDGTLVLDDTAGTLLSDLLYIQKITRSVFCSRILQQLI